jgi:O-methyltransferase
MQCGGSGERLRLVFLPVPADITTLYLDLLKRTLSRYDFGDLRYPVRSKNRALNRIAVSANATLRPLGVAIDRVKPFDPEFRYEGRDQPHDAETMIGISRLNNIQECVTAAITDGVPGDLLEAGVWRGGSVIFMRALLQVLGDTSRSVWVADSFDGLPAPDPSVSADIGDEHYKNHLLSVGLDEVKRNFEKYGLLDDRVKFLKGWFEDTLPRAPIESLSVLRADGDMYKSTMDILSPLYSKVSVGGFVIIDDYGAVPGCRRATEDFRARYSISEPMIAIDWAGAYWRKEGDA